MRQCPNCRCQVGTGIALCPYCGTKLPVGTKQPQFRPQYTDRTEPRVRSAEKAQIPYEAINTPERQENGARFDAYHGYNALPVQPMWSVYEGKVEGHSDLNTERILLILLLCMIVANTLEFIGLLLMIW